MYRTHQSGNALPVNNPFLYQLLSEKSHYFKIFCPSFCRFISRLAFIFSPFSNMDLVMIPGGTGATASYNPISLYLCLANSTRLCKTMQFIRQMLESWSWHHLSINGMSKLHINFNIIPEKSLVHIYICRVRLFCLIGHLPANILHRNKIQVKVINFFVYSIRSKQDYHKEQIFFSLTSMRQDKFSI